MTGIGESYSRSEVIRVLKDFIGQYDTKKEAAEALGISAQYMNDIMMGRRDPGKPICQTLGFQKTTQYIKFGYPRVQQLDK